MAINLNRNAHLAANLVIDRRSIVQRMVTKLLNYLHPDFTAYHVRAVNLIWALESITTASHVESIVAQSMSSSESRNGEAYDAFGILWRLSGEFYSI